MLQGDLSYYGVLIGGTRELTQIWNQSFACHAYIHVLVINIITPHDVIHYYSDTQSWREQEWQYIPGTGSRSSVSINSTLLSHVYSVSPLSQG